MDGALFDDEAAFLEQGVPGCLVIGAKLTAFDNLSLTLMSGMLLGGIPEAAAGASMLTKAGYGPAAIFDLWSTVLLAGVFAAAAGKAFIGGDDALAAIFAQALAGGAVLALVAHAMIPVALEEGGSLVVQMLLTVTGKFLVKEIGVELPPGRPMGVLGFLTPDNRRTAAIECIEDGHVLMITYEKLLEIYFQNPRFGYYFLVLTSQRLLENIARLEAIVEQSKTYQQAAVATGTSSPSI